MRDAHRVGTLDPLRDHPVSLVAAGKAAGSMAGAIAELLGERVRGAVVSGSVGTSAPLPDGWSVFAGGHPVPNDDSVAASRHALDLAQRIDDGWLLVLLSGGASAMLAAPVPPVTLADKIRATDVLLRAGTSIDRLNCVRKHVSAIKGGRLGASAARSLTLAISDVHAPVADDPSVIGSGPTVADSSTFADALDVVRGVSDVPERVMQHLERGAAGEIPETVKPGDSRLANALYSVIGGRKTAMAAAAASAAAFGYFVEALGDPTTGEARDAAQDFLRRAHAIARTSERPLCVIASGETTVRVTGVGVGGRNQEFALAATPFVANIGRAALLACAGTDGIDGPTDAAGAIVDSSTLERSRRAGLDWRESLSANDAYRFFDPLGGLIRWGPTGTNVGDVQVLLIA